MRPSVLVAVHKSAAKRQRAPRFSRKVWTSRVLRIRRVSQVHVVLDVEETHRRGWVPQGPQAGLRELRESQRRLSACLGFCSQEGIPASGTGTTEIPRHAPACCETPYIRMVSAFPGPPIDRRVASG